MRTVNAGSAAKVAGKPLAEVLALLSSMNIPQQQDIGQVRGL